MTTAAMCLHPIAQMFWPRIINQLSSVVVAAQGAFESIRRMEEAELDDQEDPPYRGEDEEEDEDDAGRGTGTRVTAGAATDQTGAPVRGHMQSCAALLCSSTM